MSDRADDRSVFALLTRLFVRRLVDNDTISPNADRHESLAVLSGGVVSLGVFVTFFLCVNYLAAFVLLPGPAALSALSDRFMFIAGALAISALSSLIVWDGLGFEPRDAAILGPLPIAARTIIWSKLTAALIFGATTTVLLNAAPSVLYPALLTINIRGIRGTTLLQLMGAHALSTMLAGLLGFFCILALRGALRVMLGDSAFQRAASFVQSALIVAMTTGLLLAPTVRSTDVRAWIARGASPVWPANAVLWYLGLNESLAGHRLADTPVVLPPRVPRISTDADGPGRATYRALLPRLNAFATWAWLSLPIAGAIAVGSFLWANRRLPEYSGDASASSRLRTAVRRAIEGSFHQDPEVEAGFYFTLQTLTRSRPHRTIVAVSLAVGITHALIVLVQRHQPAAIGASTPLGVFALSTALLLGLLTGVRYAVTVPGAPAANWTFRMAWLGDERPYLTGVKRAALAVSVLALLLLLPLHLALMGPAVALGHSMFGVLFASVFLDVLFLSYRKLPFACSYLPIDNPKMLWPAGFAALLSVAYGLSGAERWALQGMPQAVALGAGLGAVVVLSKIIDRFYRRERRTVAFDERPASPTQRLGLYEHVMGID